MKRGILWKISRGRREDNLKKRMLKNILVCGQKRKYVSQKLTWIENTAELSSGSYSLGTSCSWFSIMDWDPQWKGICSPLSPRPEYITEDTVQIASLAYWNISERKLLAWSNIYHFSSKTLHFCPDFLWLREGIYEPLCNSSQKELIFWISAKNWNVSTFEMTKGSRWQRKN